MTRWSKTIRLLLAVLLSLAIATAAGAPASAGPGSASHQPSRIELPDGFQPEGIEAGHGGTIYVGSLADGSIWRGNVRTGDGAVWVEGGGAPTVGMALDRRRHLLWVAGGPTGEVRAYDVRTLRGGRALPGRGVRFPQRRDGQPHGRLRDRLVRAAAGRRGVRTWRQPAAEDETHGVVDRRHPRTSPERPRIRCSTRTGSSPPTVSW